MKDSALAETNRPFWNFSLSENKSTHKAYRRYLYLQQIRASGCIGSKRRMRHVLYNFSRTIGDRRPPHVSTVYRWLRSYKHTNCFNFDYESKVLLNPATLPVFEKFFSKQSSSNKIFLILDMFYIGRIGNTGPFFVTMVVDTSNGCAISDLDVFNTPGVTISFMKTKVFPFYQNTGKAIRIITNGHPLRENDDFIRKFVGNIDIENRTLFLNTNRFFNSITENFVRMVFRDFVREANLLEDSLSLVALRNLLKQFTSKFNIRQISRKCASQKR